MSQLGVGARLGRYEVRGKIGAGGMAEVYLAEDTELGRRVALKILPLVSSEDDHARKRLLREARAAATLDHPHICAVYEVGETDGHRFIAMQFVEGESLDIRLKRASLDIKDAITIAGEVADALAEAHARGIIHRDIKPSNVVITPRGRAVVLDFGLAKILEDPETVQSSVETQSLLSGPGAILGTVPYMSPEQVRGEILDGRSDLFSLGVMLYEMLSGQRPFADKSSAAIASAILTREPAPIARFLAGVPAELERILAKTLRKDVNERYQTAKDLLIDLKTLRDELDFQRRLERSSSSGSGPVSASHGGLENQAALRTLPSTPSAVSGSGVASGSGVSVAAPQAAWSWRVPTAIGAIALLSAAGWFIWQNMNVRWAKAKLPQIEALANSNDNSAAFELAASVENYLPGDPTLSRLMPVISQTVTVSTDPAGARIYLKRFAPDASGALPPRELVGTTPLSNHRVPRGEYVLSIEKDGYAPTERTVSGVFLRAIGLNIPPPPIQIEQKLTPTDKMPAGMVAVPSGDYRLVAWSRPTDARVALANFFIDKFEVSNQEYKQFINAGGYVKKDFWKHPFVRDGKEISWEDAMKLFVDRTGLPGPRNWSSQNVPDGKAEYPVTDVTWYEASAYAASRGKQLPSVFQWEKTAGNGAVAGPTNYMPWGAFYPGDPLEHHANFESQGTQPVMSSEFGMSPFGAYNMAGNVQEWTGTDTTEGRIATGGAWGEPTYTFAQYATLPAFYASNKVGFRCVLTAPDAKGDQGMARIEIAREIPVFKRSSEADFNKWRTAYDYEKTPLDPKIESVQTPEWQLDKITFNGADGERAIAYLYLPHNFSRPLQVIHMAPAGDVDRGFRSLPASIEAVLGPIIKSGRAAFGVVLKGYIERLNPPSYVFPDPRSVEYLERTVNRVKDLRRGLDYLATRSDIDLDKLAFYGPSAGAQIGLILAAVEPRYKAVALMGAGLEKAQAGWQPEANPINFAPHILVPKLILQGRYDEDTPLKTQTEPLLKVLPDPTRLIVYDGGHVTPPALLVPAMGSFLDQVLGPVRRQ